MADQSASQYTPSPLLDDETLSESERQLISLFDRRASGVVADTPVPASAEDEVEPSITPGTQPDPSAASAPPSQGQVEGPETVGGAENVDIKDRASTDGEGDAGVEGETPSPNTQSTTTPAFTFAGQDYTPEQLTRAVQVAAWHEQLNNQQVQAIDALLSGQYRLVPANEAVPVAPNQPGQPATSPPASTPASSTAPSAITDDDAGEWLDPRAQSEITRLRNELNGLQQSVQQSITPLVQQQYDNSMAQKLAMIDSATQSFATKYSLSADETQPILAALTEAQVLPGLVNRHGGDVAAAINAGLDMMFWTTPTFREPYIRAQSAAEQASTSEQERAAKVKQQQMTALSASGGSVPRRDPRPANTPEGRHQGMVDELRAAMNGQ